MGHRGQRPIRGAGVTTSSQIVIADRLSAAERAGFMRVAGLFDRMLAEGLHDGAQLAVLRNGEQLFAACGGKVVQNGDPVAPSTLFQMRSITKLLATLVALRSFERGRFDFDDPVAAHWPEFANEGKQAITIRHVMSHRAGIPDGPALPLIDLQDRSKVRKAIEAMPLVWEPGTENGYHAHTIGWVLQELVMRWEGKPLELLLREEVLAPLGIHDIHLGLAEKDYPRMAKMTVGAEVRTIQARRSAMSDFINSYDGIRLPMASVMGVASATELAKLMAVLANGGESNGYRVVSERSLGLASVPTNAQGYVDLRLNHPIRWGLGFILGTTPDIYGSSDRPHLIGHAGGGANVAWADLKTGLAVAFLCNRMLEREQSWIRYRRIGDAIYAALG